MSIAPLLRSVFVLATAHSFKRFNTVSSICSTSLQFIWNRSVQLKFLYLITAIPQSYRTYSGNFKRLTDIVRCCLVVDTPEDMLKLVQVRGASFSASICAVIVLLRKFWITASTATQANLHCCKWSSRCGSPFQFKFWV